MKPNIFEIATKELHQDAFIAWLIQWADPINADYDIALHECGTEFVTELIKKYYPDFNERIQSIVVERQWQNIDVCAEINNKYLIIIEDKVYSGQHSGQLRKYKIIAENWCEQQTPKFYPPICIYLKTGNEAKQTLGFIEKAGYQIYVRNNFLSFLERFRSITNDIFYDFITRLRRIEQSNKEWDNKIIDKWNGDDWQGFILFLEDKMEITGWRFVNNPQGGFWSVAIGWSNWDKYPLYIQLEQDKLCFKLCTDPDELDEDLPEDFSPSETRNHLCNLIVMNARNSNIESIRRPDRFGKGKYMTVAVVDSINWLGDKTEKINKEKVVEQLLLFKNFLLQFKTATSF